MFFNGIKFCFIFFLKGYYSAPNKNKIQKNGFGILKIEYNVELSRRRVGHNADCKSVSQIYIYIWQLRVTLKTKKKIRGIAGKEISTLFKIFNSI